MKKLLLGIIPMILLVAGCAGSGKSVENSTANSDLITLDQALNEAASRIDERIIAGSKIAPINFNSPHDKFSDYTLEELTANLVESRKLTVVDRREIDLIRNEVDFQYSGEVGDDSMQQIGRMLGAQSIISGNFTDMGGFFRIMIRVLNVQNASVEVQYRANIVSDVVTAALLTGGKRNAVAITPRQTSSGGSSSTTQVTQAPATPVHVQQQLPVAPTTLNYRIGDIGPAGGLIFYDKGNNSGGWRYLEAAPVDTEKQAAFFIRHTSPHNSYIGSNLSTEQGLGDGKKNTISIVSHLSSIGQWDMSAQVCEELEFNGYSDWYMPSFMELSLIYGNLHRKGLGNFKNEVYYSSSLDLNQFNRNEVGLSRSFNFADGSSNFYYTDGAKPVRAIRQF